MQYTGQEISGRYEYGCQIIMRATSLPRVGRSRKNEEQWVTCEVGVSALNTLCALQLTLLVFS